MGEFNDLDKSFFKNSTPKPNILSNIKQPDGGLGAMAKTLEPEKDQINAVGQPLESKTK